MGVSAGLALVEAGARVVVLEASAIGAGASGRNGGLVVPSLPRVGPERLTQILGPERGAALARLVAGSAEATFALIRRLGLSCEAVQAGWLNPAHAACLAPSVAARAGAWAAAGGASVWLEAGEARDRLGSDQVFGALFDPTGGHLNPLAYARELARAFLASGGVLHDGTAVMRADAGWVLTTPGGRVRAPWVLQCTNGQSTGFRDAVRASTVPLLVYQMATPVLDAARRARVLPRGESFSDTRNNLLACRWTSQGRLVTGGMAMLHAGAMPRLLASHTRRLRRVFPALAGVPLERIWRGQAALTGDFLPRLFAPAAGWIAPIGCNGRGIALCTVLGRVLAGAVLTGRMEDLPLPLVPPRPIRPQFLARLAPQILLPIGDWQDRRAERSPARPR